MKRILTIGLSLIIVVGMLALVGCDGDTKDSSGTDMEDGATMTEESTVTTEGSMDGMDGMEVPAATPGAYTDLTPEQAKQLIDTTPDLVILDVSPAYDNGHLPGAINYYIGDGSLEAAIPTLDQSLPYLVYCHVDSASIGGAQALVDAGFPTVYRLQGNYSAWVDAGYPIEK